MRTLLISGAPAVAPLVGPLSQKYDLVAIVPNNAAHFKAMGVQNIEPIDGVGGPVVGEELWADAARLVKRTDLAQLEAQLPPKLREWFVGWAHRQWLQHIAWIRFMEGTRAKRDIAGLIVHEDVTQQMLGAVRWAQSHGIPTLHVTHGTYGGVEYANRMEMRLQADYLSCCGPLQAEWFIANGALRDRVRVNGMPGYDRWSLLQRDKALCRAQLHLPQDKPVIGYMGTWQQDFQAKSEGERCEQMYRAYLEACKRNGWCIAVKVHPAAEGNKQHGVEWSAKVAQELGVHGPISAARNEVMMFAVDCWVGPAQSSLMTEAAIAEVPGTSIEVQGRDVGWPDVQAQGSDLVAQVESACKAMLTPEWAAARQDARRKHVYETNYLCDGRATERVCKWVEEIMPASAPSTAA